MVGCDGVPVNASSAAGSDRADALVDCIEVGRELHGGAPRRCAAGARRPKPKAARV